MASPKIQKPKLISLLFIFLGSFIFLFSTFLNPIAFVGVSGHKTPEIEVYKPNLKPTKVQIPRIERTLEVTDGHVFGNEWEISKTAVSYYTDSALPGEGNTVLYGHNKAQILGNLVLMQKGDKIHLFLENGQFLTYEVFEAKKIRPDQVEILKKSNSPILTIYTCNGFLDQSRFVVIANKIAS